MPLKAFQKSKLFELLQLLTPVECTRFKLWLDSRWPDYDATLVKLYTLLSPYYPDFQLSDSKRQEIFLALFPKKDFDANRLSALMSSLSGQVEAFLIHECVRNDKVLRTTIITEKLAERGKQEWAIKKANKLIDTLEKKPVKNWKALSQLTLLYEQRLRQPLPTRSKTLKETDLYKANTYLDQFYKLGKYRFLTEFAEREKILEEEHQLTEKISLLDTIAPGNNAPVYNIYQTYIKNRTKPPITNFEYLKDAFLNHSHQLSVMDQSIILILTINTGARARLSGYIEILPDLLALYKIGIEKKLLFYHGQLTGSTFSNIVTIGNLCNDFEFTEHFIKQNILNLPIEIREDAHLWANTHLAFHSKNPQLWDIALKLHDIQPFKSSFAIRTRVLNIQMNFEDLLGGDDSITSTLLQLCKSFSRQVRKSKVYGTGRLEALRQFAHYTYRYARLIDKRRDTPENLTALREAINGSSNIHAKTWLIHQIGKKLGE